MNPSFSFMNNVLPSQITGSNDSSIHPKRTRGLTFPGWIWGGLLRERDVTPSWLFFSIFFTFPAFPYLQEDVFFNPSVTPPPFSGRAFSPLFTECQLMMRVVARVPTARDILASVPGTPATIPLGTLTQPLYLFFYFL